MTIERFNQEISKPRIGSLPFIDFIRDHKTIRNELANRYTEHIKNGGSRELESMMEIKNMKLIESDIDDFESLALRKNLIDSA